MSEPVNVYLDFEPHDGQLEVLKGFVSNKVTDKKYGTLVTGRQWGKSKLAYNTLAYWLLYNNDSRGAWVSPYHQQAEKVYEEIVRDYKQVIARAVGGNKKKVEFINGSTINFLSAERYDGIRGFSFDYVIVDEAGFVSKQAMEEAILPTMAVRGKKCLIVSTPKGEGWFKDFYDMGVAGRDGYVSFRGVTTDNPFHDAQFIEDSKKNYPTSLFEQEFLGMFTDDGADVFEGLSEVTILNGPTEPNAQHRYFMGVDVGVRSDFTVAVVMDGNGRVCQVYRDTNKRYEEYADNIIALANKYKCKDILVEENSYGEGLCQILEKKLPITRRYTNNKNKAEGIENLRADILNHRVELPNTSWLSYYDIEFKALTFKLTDATKATKYEARQGFHDDSVMSTMLANEMRRERGNRKPMSVRTIQPAHRQHNRRIR